MIFLKLTYILIWKKPQLNQIIPYIPKGVVKQDFVSFNSWLNAYTALGKMMIIILLEILIKVELKYLKFWFCKKLCFCHYFWWRWYK